MLTVVTVRGVSASAAAVQATAVSTIIFLFGWLGSDSVFSFCFGLLFWFVGFVGWRIKIEIAVFRAFCEKVGLVFGSKFDNKSKIKAILLG